MPAYRSAQGKMVDMSQLAARNEKVRAVGNMNVNARGDILDSQNRIIKDTTKRVKSNYQNIVSQTPKQPTPVAPIQKHEPIQADEEPIELTEEEKELFQDDEEDVKK